jgi:DNA-binding NtrC family response regulator
MPYIMVKVWKRATQSVGNILYGDESHISETINVLVVEDESKLAVLIKNELEKHHNFEAEVETDSTKALDKINSKEFDCVVSDYLMPGTDGLELLKDVREHHPKLPFIFFTGKGSEKIAEEAFSAGATDYIIKEPEHDVFRVLEERIKDAVRYRRDSRWRKKSLRRQYLAIVLAIISILVGLGSILL